MVADNQPLQAEPAGRRFSDWLEDAPIGRTAARELLVGLGIEPIKVRLPGISAAVAWLDPDAISAMDAAAARVASGESVSQVCGHATAEPVPIRDRSRLDADGMTRALSTALQPQQGAPPSSPLTRARALREAATEGLLLTSAELAELAGLSPEGIRRLRSGMRIKGYRAWRVRGSAADPETVWRLTETDWAKVAIDRGSRC